MEEEKKPERKYKSFKELSEKFHKKKGIKKYWSKPGEIGIKNDIDLI